MRFPSRVPWTMAFAIGILATATPHAVGQAATGSFPDFGIPVASQREQAPVVRQWIEQRFDTVLPRLMRHAGIDMWIVVTREYNDDPVFRSMAPLTTYSSRRRTILVFHDRGPGQGVDRLSMGRFDYDGLFEVVRTHNERQYEGLRQLVDERKPQVIGINTSGRWNHADGLTANERDMLVDALGEEHAARLTSAEMLAVAWLEEKLPEETEMYRHVQRVAHRVIAQAYSNAVIVPGVTTTEDVRWWMRQRVVTLGLGKWFHPSVSVQRRGGLDGAERAADGGVVIQRGDLLHCDFGIVYYGFSTDTQHHAYVLLPGETDAPQGIKDGLAAGNRLQDITMESAQPGVTGNQALERSLTQARAEGLLPSIYWHAIGYHGHAAGPPMGMSDYQEGVPVRGDYTYRPNTWYSVELNVRFPVPEWGGQEVRFALEEDAALLEGGWNWPDGRQTELYLIH